MSITAMMVHRCTVERNAQTVTSGYNVKKASAWQVHIKDLKCRLIPQISNVRGMGGVVGEGSPISQREFVKRVHQFSLPKGTDITEQDRIVNVLDAGGKIINSGPFDILLVRPATGMSTSHIRLIAERIF